MVPMKIFASLFLCLFVTCSTSEPDSTITSTDITTTDAPDQYVPALVDYEGLLRFVRDLSDVKCQCAVFTTEEPSETDLPILVQAPMTVDCDTTGEDNCLKLCTALAVAAEDRGPQLLCSIVGHYNELKASVHSRICDAKKWTYTGLTSPDVICCYDNGVIDCKDQIPDPDDPSDPITKEN